LTKNLFSGVLIAKKHVFLNPSPHGAGGGSVFFVTPEKHFYAQVQ